MHRQTPETPTLPPARPFGLTRDAWGRLMLIDDEGRRHENVRVVRAFPIADPEHWISVCDARGQELALIEDPQTLAEPVRRLLHEELAQRDFIPRIVRILRITAIAEGTEWRVETDRGPTTFRLEDEDALRALGDQRLLLTDTHGIRYLIPGLSNLDPASRRKLERYL